MKLFFAFFLFTVPTSLIFGFDGHGDSVTNGDAGHSNSGDVVEGRIIGGINVHTITQAPYMVSVREERNGVFEHVCGGSIITPLVILTAAHCITETMPMQVMAGTTELAGTDGVFADVARAVAHENYNTRFENDVAVLLLVVPLPISDKISTLDLSLDGPTPDGARAFISGWGGTRCSEDISPVLKGLDVTVYSEESCANLIGPDFYKGDQTCAGNLDIHTDEIWFGDSGGPLVYNHKQIGVLSMGECKETYPDTLALYASIFYHSSWIVSKTTEFIREREPQQD